MAPTLVLSWRNWASLSSYVTVTLFCYGSLLLTVNKAYNALPVLLALPALGLLLRRKLDFVPDLKRLFSVFLIFLAPILLSILLGYSSFSYLDRPLRSIYYLLIGALILKTRPRLDVFILGLALGQLFALVLLIQQKLANVSRPALWSNPIPVAEIAVAVFALLIVAWGWPRGAKKWIALLGQACCLPIILITQTRGALLSLVGVLLFVFLCLICWKRLRCQSVLLLCSVLVLLSTLMLSQTSLGDRFKKVLNNIQNYELSEKFTSTGIRLELWKESLLLATERPLTGYGNLTHRERAGELIRQGRIDGFVVDFVHFHSDYFEALATRGVPGLLSVLLLYLTPLGLFYRYRFTHPYLSLAGMALIVSYMVSSLTDVPLKNGLTSMFFFMAVVVVTAFLNIAPAQDISPE